MHAFGGVTQQSCYWSLDSNHKSNLRTIHEALCCLQAGMLFATVVEDNCNAPTGATPQVQSHSYQAPTYPYEPLV